MIELKEGSWELYRMRPERDDSALIYVEKVWGDPGDVAVVDLLVLELGGNCGRGLTFNPRSSFPQQIRWNPSDPLPENLVELARYMRLSRKWDGCMNVWPEYQHFCERADMDAFVALMDYLEKLTLDLVVI